VTRQVLRDPAPQRCSFDAQFIVRQDYESLGVTRHAHIGIGPERFADPLRPLGYGSNHGKNPFTETGGSVAKSSQIEEAFPAFAGRLPRARRKAHAARSARLAVTTAGGRIVFAALFRKVLSMRTMVVKQPMLNLLFVQASKKSRLASKIIGVRIGTQDATPLKRFACDRGRPTEKAQRFT
jgi:hypothetical protein